MLALPSTPCNPRRPRSIAPARTACSLIRRRRSSRRPLNPRARSDFAHQRPPYSDNRRTTTPPSPSSPRHSRSTLPRRWWTRLCNSSRPSVDRCKTVALLSISSTCSSLSASEVLISDSLSLSFCLPVSLSRKRSASLPPSLFLQPSNTHTHARTPGEPRLFIQPTGNSSHLPRSLQTRNNFQLTKRSRHKSIRLSPFHARGGRTRGRT